MCCRNLLAIVISLMLTGCSGGSQPKWHERYGWSADQYFADARVIALCHAIESDDIEEIDRLIADGVDVNSVGKGKMTPLLWAYPDNKLNRFKRLLEHGADPNVVVESDFNTRSRIHPGQSVTNLAAGSQFPGYFECVMNHGGDVEYVDTSTQEPLMHVVIKAPTSKLEKRKRIQLLLEKGVNLDQVHMYFTPTMCAVGHGGQYDIALMLLSAGADPGIHSESWIKKLVHVVAEEEQLKRPMSEQQKADLQALVQFLKDHGESFEEAKRDLERWREWCKVCEPKEYTRRRTEEAIRHRAKEHVDTTEKAN